jgi:hypothetical protein
MGIAWTETGVHQSLHELFRKLTTAGVAHIHITSTSAANPQYLQLTSACPISPASNLEKNEKRKPQSTVHLHGCCRVSAGERARTC